ncbi:VOC family protein [Sporichthya polymorpha]|uniref:VOC family protein n=1 Tax=Sporichthya polymorpha TaxID=35751 RepID=UPI0003648792|nr:VOC family protein [Sporichthya polymorpha]
MSLSTAGVTIDCPDPRALATFWTAALDYEIGQDYDGEFVSLQPAGGGTYLGLQRVAEPRTGKNRVHLDFHCTDRAAEVERLVGLGATVLGEHEFPGFAWTVLADPAGNEFCVAAPTD